MNDILDALSILNLIIDDLPESNKYSFLIGKLRKKMKKAHPDSGGNANEFNKINSIYKKIAQLRKTDVSEKLFIKYIKENDIPIIQQRAAFKVSLENLIEHANLLSQCNLENSDNDDRVYGQITVTAYEPKNDSGQDYDIESFVHYFSLKYNQAGSYSLPLSLKVIKNSKLTFNTLGFARTKTIKTENNGVFVHNIIFNQNNINFTIKLQLYINT